MVLAEAEKESMHDVVEATELVRAPDRGIQELKRLEKTVFSESNNCLQSAMRVAEALTAIREQKLYRLSGYQTLHEYVKRTFLFAKSRTYQLLELNQICQDLALDHKSIPPHGGLLTERSFRPLAVLDKDQRQKVWREVLKETDGAKITPAVIKRAAKKLFPQPRSEKEYNDKPPDEVIHAWIGSFLSKYKNEDWADIVAGIQSAAECWREEIVESSLV
jgi:hypothetical protein